MLSEAELRLLAVEVNENGSQDSSPRARENQQLSSKNNPLAEADATPRGGNIAMNIHQSPA
jgi:hypothetical protein